LNTSSVIASNLLLVISRNWGLMLIFQVDEMLRAGRTSLKNDDHMQG